MTIRSFARRLAVTCALALSLGSLTVAPAESAPVFIGAIAGTTGEAHTHGSNCSFTDTTPPEDGPSNVVENGPAVSRTATRSGTFISDMSSADTGTATATATGKARITSAGGNLRALELSVAGTGTISTAVATSACEAHAFAGVGVEFGFVVARPGWLTIRSESTRHTGAAVTLQGNEESGFSTEEVNLHGSNVRTFFVPAGVYNGSVNLSVDIVSTVSRSVSGSANLRMTFAVAGSQSTAPAGKAKKYVDLGARSCTDGSVAVKVTKKVKRVAKMDAVTLFVNGRRVAKDNNPKAKEAYTVRTPGARPKDVTVRALVTFVKQKGKPAKTAEVTASYVGCAPS